MVRPKDYGDQFPSDTDDVTPGDPTGGFNEIDYKIERGGIRSQDVETPRDFIPDADIPNAPAIPRTTYAAIILAWANAKEDWTRFYWVFRQDGQFGLARHVDILHEQDFRPGNLVFITEDEHVGTWFVHGNIPASETAVLDAYSDIPTRGFRSFPILWNKTWELLPIDGTFGENYRDVNLLLPGVIQVGGNALYEINFTVTLQVDNPDPRVNFWHIQAGCVGGNETLDPVRIAKLWIDRQVGLRVKRRIGDCAATLTINTDLKGSVLNRKSGGSKPIWTDTPEIGGSLHVGARRGGWLKVGRGFSQLWLGPTSGNAWRVRMFTDSVTKPQSFVVVKRGGFNSCVDLGFFPHGVSGDYSILTPTFDHWAYCGSPSSCYPVYKTAIVKVRNGLTFEAPNSEFPVYDFRTTCPDFSAKDDDPCA